MRAAFLEALLVEAHKDTRIILVSPDTGGFHCETFRRELPGQYLNAGIAEQNAVGIAAGLALAGRRPFVFNTLSFNSFRCFEQVRLDVCAMRLSVVLVGVGAGLDYGLFGPSHHAMEDMSLMRSLPDMSVFSPADDTVAAALVQHTVQGGGPAYLRLDRAGTPLVYQRDARIELSQGLALLRTGRDLLIAATGRMVERAMEVADTLSASLVDTSVVDVFRLKPFPARRFLDLAESCPRIATLEEHSASGGLGTAILEVLADHGLTRSVRRFGLPDRFYHVCGDRDYMHKASGLDAAALAARLVDNRP
ncbi:MAG: 1-deoxy-D-xylulose-5-phosphate synthase [Acidobacteria bacterium]|nr:1-deoxy-D-xylulose-5-phosphate synthase [Acidobacteriota bacterium]